MPPENEDGDPLHGEPHVWHWHACCKTQYASVLGDDHLVRCHTSLVALLDQAAELEFEVTVRDETHYWETRDTSVLLAEVREMNRIVAHIAGAFHDALREHGHVAGAIFEHPEFTRALYFTSEIGEEVSPRLYVAVAQVLTYIYQLTGRTVATVDSILTSYGVPLLH